jgi:hypothetical protein
MPNAAKRRKNLALGAFATLRRALTQGYELPIDLGRDVLSAIALAKAEGPAESGFLALG